MARIEKEQPLEKTLILYSEQLASFEQNRQTALHRENLKQKTYRLS